jgi:hypothetical protein
MQMRLTCGLSAIAIGAVLSAAIHAQAVPEVKLPASPAGQAAVQLGGTWEKTQDGQRYANGKWLVVNYGRPILRGRTNIFGAGEEYGKTVKGDAPVWRAGANDTTRLITQIPLVVGDKTIAPGTYNVFVDLQPARWELILNTQAVQEKFDPNDKVNLFGAANYDPKFDIARAPMTVRTGSDTVEQFTIGFVNATESSVTLTMAWDRTVASIDLKAAR